MALKGCSNFQWHIGDELHFSVAYREFTLSFATDDRGKYSFQNVRPIYFDLLEQLFY